MPIKEIVSKWWQFKYVRTVFDFFGGVLGLAILSDAIAFFRSGHADEYQ
jgi:hypothetical protein